MEKEITLVLNYLDKIGEKLGVGANMIWPYLMKQQLLAGYMSLIIPFILCTVTYVIWKSYANDPTRHEHNWSDTMYFRFWATLIMAAASLASIARFIFFGFFQIFNTEYMAFRAVLNLIEPVTK